MSLRFDLTNIRDYQEVCFEPATEPGADPTELRVVTAAIIHLTVYLDASLRKEKDLREFAVRTHIWQDVYGPLMSTSDGPYRITYLDLAAHVGLTTNVAPLTRNQWKRKLTEGLERDAERSVDRHIADNAKVGCI